MRESEMRKLGVFAVAVAAVAGMFVAVPAAPAAAHEPAAVKHEPAAIRWERCRAYSDKELDGQRHGHELQAFKREVARRQCGTLAVPLDYDEPGGRQLEIAVTRYPATGRRLGVLAVNPGGPGASGVLLPADVNLGQTGGLGRRFDMIGFDPRGVGDSTPRLACPPEVAVTQLTPDREEARKQTVERVALTRACAANDPALTASLTIVNIARDLDRIRAALGEQKLSYFGISWGTALGGSYQTLFPQRVKRMVLDSVLTPDGRMDRIEDDEARAFERISGRFAAWLARFNDRFGLGRTQADVQAELARIGRFFARYPQEVPGFEGVVTDLEVALSITDNSPNWPGDAERVLALKKVADGARSALSGRTLTPKAAPEFFNDGVNVMVTCNGDTGIHDFEPWFARFEERRKRFPVAGITTGSVPFCAGLPIPQRPERFANNGVELLLVGHKFEFTTPIEWTNDMRARIGGATLVVEDDVHASLIDIPCASNAVAFLVSGVRPYGSCPGVAEPVPGKEPAIKSWRGPGRVH
ncbi:MAG TPA: alpha/beta fold hydrolase [Streptosporangiaceae bacterium]